MIKYLKEMYRFRELLFALTTREIKVRYKQTLLGISWALLQPFSLMLIFTIVFGYFLKIDSNGVPYPLFYYSALLPWTFFATSLSLGSLAVVNNGNLVSKVYFPREALPFASILAALLDFLMALSVFLILIIWYKAAIGPNFLFIIPIMFIAVIFVASCNLLTSALNVMWRDIKFIIPLLLQLWMFATPIIYPTSAVPEHLRFIYILNPMAPVIDNFRRVTVLNLPPKWDELFLSFGVSILLFFLTYYFFKNKEKVFADVI